MGAVPFMTVRIEPSFSSRGGSVVRTDGFHAWPLRRGLDPLSWVAVLSNRTLQVNERKRTVYLRPTGVVLGSGPATENVIGLPDGSVTYVLQAMRTNVVDRLDGRGETHLLYRHRIPRQSCGEYSSVAYANGLILYVDTEGPMAVLDPAGRVAPIDLTRAVLRLQPARTSMRSLGADWAANYN